jgi:hypothetical protein
MPHFRGHTEGYRDEWRRIQQAAADGGLKPEADRTNNLLFKDV